MPPIEGDPVGLEPGLVLASTSPLPAEPAGAAGHPVSLPGARSATRRRSSGSRASLEPLRLAERLAMAKASSLAGEEPGAAIIGCDQLVSFAGRVFGKPGTADRADRAALRRWPAETHELITALVVIRGR